MTRTDYAFVTCIGLCLCAGLGIRAAVLLLPLAVCAAKRLA